MEGELQVDRKNSRARVLGEEVSWYWERKKAPHCLLAVPVGEESPNLHWQTMKDPHVSTWPLRAATTKLTECWALIVMDPTQGYQRFGDAVVEGGVGAGEISRLLGA